MSHPFKLFKGIEIDEKLFPIIEALSMLNIKTIGSCQLTSWGGLSYIALASLDDLNKFVNTLLKNKYPKSKILNNWEITPTMTSDNYETEVSYHITVKFDPSEIPSIEAILLSLTADVTSEDMLGYLRKKILQLYENGETIDTHYILYELPYGSLPKTYDTQDFEKLDEKASEEDIDFENGEILGINGNTIEMWAGGDWQMCYSFKMVFKKTGAFYYVENSKKLWENDGRKAPGTIEFLKMIFGPELPNELKDIETEEL